MVDDPQPGDPASAMSLGMLRAVAHPTRRSILRRLAARDFARAADLAADLGLPANQVSFHLRVLGEAGLIRETPEHARDRRDRVWQAIPGTMTVGATGDAELDAAISQGFDEDHLDLMRRVNEHHTANPGDSDGHSTFMFLNARLTEAEFRELVHDFRTRIEELTIANRANQDAPLWQVHLLAGDETL
ncbi:helix-turn-helix domain-containing protein [Microbacterium sp. KUDC0406]|uniref:winged helix-turn-helix domain-containing protein n=1 Tax=Microbacterium sp. KUDC0406 TaxID=2909588 RepID=UPI001F32C062|nr:helix-turn-helix domain-containing protein [Microbacterium sp. KUDC0406]UJP09435.1 helix-turn-helix domain-containing protein [Microbacterium sp. KUDC0406]